MASVAFFKFGASRSHVECLEAAGTVGQVLWFRIYTLPLQGDDGAEEGRELAWGRGEWRGVTEKHADGTARFGVRISQNPANGENVWPVVRCCELRAAKS